MAQVTKWNLDAIENCARSLSGSADPSNLAPSDITSGTAKDFKDLSAKALTQAKGGVSSHIFGDLSTSQTFAEKIVDCANKAAMESDASEKLLNGVAVVLMRVVGAVLDTDQTIARSFGG